MKKDSQIKRYSPIEEAINIWSHVLGIFLSIIAIFLLVKHAIELKSVLHIVSLSIYGFSMLTLYTASSIYHSRKNDEQRIYMRVFDHASIYILIAGTYTPFTIISLHGKIGWIIFGLSWGMALMGIILKLFFTGRFSLLSTLIYIFMGWMIIFAIKPLMSSLSAGGIKWLFAGGIAYTLGGILYVIKKIKFNHAIFHILVLIGSICHFISIYYYV
jgi:hemolysin III